MSYSTKTDLVEGASDFLRLTPCTLTNGVITAFGTKIDFDLVTAMKPKYLGSVSSDTKTETIKKELTNGTTLQVDKRGETVNPVTGSVVASESSSSYDSIAATVVTNKTNQDSLIAIIRNSSSSPVVASIHRGRDVQSYAPVGYSHLLGNLTGDIELDGKQDFQEVSITVTGNAIASSPTDMSSSFNTAATGAGNTITPYGKDALTIKAITAGNWTDMVKGKITDTAAS